MTHSNSMGNGTAASKGNGEGVLSPTGSKGLDWSSPSFSKKGIPTAGWDMIFERISSTILFVDSNCTILDVNRIPQGLSGTNKDYIGRDIREALSPTFYKSDNLNCALGRIFSKEVRSIDLPRVQFFVSEQEKRYWNIKIVALNDSSIENMAMIQIDDITSAIKVENNLDVLWEFNERIVENIPSGILVLDLEGRIRLANRAAEKILEIQQKKLIGLLHQEFFGKRLDKPENQDSWNYKTLVGRNALTYQLKDGKKITIGYSLAPLIESNGKAKGTIAIFQDLTEILLLKNRLIQSEKMAGIGTLAAGIAHEFNNLIGGMMGYAQLASSTTDKKDYEKAIDVVFTSSKRAKEVITTLLTFSRRTSHETEVIRVDKLVSQVLSLVERDLQKRNIEIGFSVDSGFRLHTDVGQLQQVLLNLIINAKHAMPDGGKLAVSAAVYGKEIHLRISDSGIGISKNNLERIFEPFFTTKGSIGAGKEEGTGLGLSLSYGLIKDLGGEIKVESEVGKGSVFTIILPMYDEGIESEEFLRTKADTDCYLPTEIDSVSRRLNVLVVDDEQTVLDLMYQLLSREGHSVVTASTGFMAIEKVRNSMYDLIFIDAVMPGIDGVETLKQIREMMPDAKAVIITGALGTELEKLKEHTTELDAHILSKPFEIDDVLQYVKLTGGIVDNSSAIMMINEGRE